MSDLNKVSAGQNFVPRAGAWNAFIDAARYVKNMQGGMTVDAGKRQARAGIVLIHNISDDDMPVFAPMYISGPVVEVEDEETALKFMDGLPAFTADKFSEEEDLEKPLVILQQPIKSDEMGKALILGITPVRLINSDADDENEYVVPSLEDATAFETAASGGCRMIWKGEGDESWAIVQMNTAASEEYNGPFKIIDGESGLKIIDGMELDDSYAGYAMGNGELEAIESGVPEGSAPGYVCLKAEFDESSETFSWSYIISEYPETEATESIAIYPLGYVDIGEDGESRKVIQFHHAVPQLWVLGECESDASESS